MENNGGFEFRNESEGTMGWVQPGARGKWIAALTDTDADAVVPGSLKIFPAAQKDAAISYARKIAGVRS